MKRRVSDSWCQWRGKPVGQNFSGKNLQGVHGGCVGHSFPQWRKLLVSSAEQFGVHEEVMWWKLGTYVVSARAVERLAVKVAGILCRAGHWAQGESCHLADTGCSCASSLFLALSRCLSSANLSGRIKTKEDPLCRAPKSWEASHSSCSPFLREGNSLRLGSSWWGTVLVWCKSAGLGQAKLNCSFYSFCTVLSRFFAHFIAETFKVDSAFPELFLFMDSCLVIVLCGGMETGGLLLHRLVTLTHLIFKK